ncbi:MAG: hypothetical protein HY565_04500 [Candidatus Kerfeldbacteria bacterium]|nr:hypothetical protein [Candidatus Kerfeldbacteria bacterium]
MKSEPRNLKVEGQQTGGEELLSPQEQAALAGDTYTSRAWQSVGPGLTADALAGEQRTILREQRRQLFDTIDRVQGKTTTASTGRRDKSQPHVTMRGDSYLFKRPLGVGGSGVAIDAIQQSTNDPCIVKCITGLDRAADTVDQITQARKAIVEVAVLKKLAGLHAPKLLDAQLAPHPDNHDRRMMLIAMEKVSGQSGWDVVQEYDPTEQADELLKRAHALLQAIADIHQAGVLHLDLKPEHVFYSNDGADVTFIDFGIGHLPQLAEQQRQGQRVTSPHYAEAATDQQLGTPLFAPPEADATSKFDAYGAGRIIQTFLYKELISDPESRAQALTKLPDSLQALHHIAEQMTVEAIDGRLDIPEALTQFYAAYPDYAPAEEAVRQQIAG